jgi:N-acetylneuraminic acid mutarotase
MQKPSEAKKDALKDPATPEDLSPEQKEIRNFKKSPLARRISDDILNPNTTRELLKQKKFQFDQLTLNRSKLRGRVSKTYFYESLGDAYHTVKMPLIRVLVSKYKPPVAPDSPTSEVQPLNYPEISEVFWTRLDVFGWKPETRQHATLTVVQNKFYLIGGVSRSIISDINSFNPGTRKWEKILTVGAEAEPRFGHSVVEYEKKLFVFGGGTDFNSVHKQRECLNGVKSFTAETKEWSNVRCEGHFIGTRKHHCSSIVGKHMLMHGGLNQRNNLLNDSAILNLSKQKWKIVNLKGNGPGFCAFHTAVTVLDVDQRNSSSIYKVQPSRINSVKLPGIYVFGGIDQGRHATNELFLVNVGCKNLYWTRPETFGTPPSPRFQHSMVFNEKVNVLVVFGGRIDVNNSNAYTCFNDLFLLKMDNLTWVNVQVLGNVPIPRSGHSFASFGSKVYLFAGVGTSTFCSSDLYSLELHPRVTRQLIEEEERRKVKEVEMEIIKARKAGVSLDEKRNSIY